jgi:UPF0176 protein
MNNYEIILYYKYVNLNDTEAVLGWQKILCSFLGLKGRIIVASEGINGTLEGTKGAISEYRKEMERDDRFVGIHYKVSVGSGDSFPRLSVKLRKEIVSLHLGDRDFSPIETTGKRLAPEELRTWYEQNKDFVILDMRNDYECKVGQFAETVMSGLKNFRDLRIKLPELEKFKNKTILTVCTGGVRCEKASGFLVKEGFRDVYQLEGGIVSYMERYPNQNFQGKLYVFDKRVTMGYDTNSPEHQVIGKCDRCGRESDNYGDCANISCPRHLVCCSECRAKDGQVFCSEECRSIVSQVKI